jgi:hypothetical protein
MAGSYNHCAGEDGRYEEMFFMINWLAQPQPIWSFDHRMAASAKIKMASDAYFCCLRKEEPWPDFMGEIV